MADTHTTRAHAMYEHIAALLATRLQHALDEHLAKCGCAERTGFAYCDQAMELFRLLPAGYQIITG